MNGPVQLRGRTIVTDDNVSLRVVEAGSSDGEPIVFVHGLASAASAWGGVMRDPRLADHYRLIAFDLRGHGAQRQVLTPGQLDVSSSGAADETWSCDLDAVLTSLTGFHLVGWSFGCRVVGSWLQRRHGPPDTGSVTFIAGPSVLGPLPPTDPAAGVARMSALPVLAHATEGGGYEYADLILRPQHQSSTGVTNTDWASQDATLRDDVAAVASNTDPSAIAAALKAPSDYREFFRDLASEKRLHMRTFLPFADGIFDLEPTRSSWAQANVAPSLVTGQPHVWPITEPSSFAEAILPLPRRSA